MQRRLKLAGLVLLGIAVLATLGYQWYLAWVTREYGQHLPRIDITVDTTDREYYYWHFDSNHVQWDAPRPAQGHTELEAEAPSSPRQLGAGCQPGARGRMTCIRYRIRRRALQGV